MKKYAFPVAVLVAAVLIALGLGGFFKPSGIQDVVLVPVNKEKSGYKVTVESIIARRKAEGDRARLDLLLTIERLDGEPIDHDPYLAAEAWILKVPYRPDDVIEVPEEGLDVPEMGYAVPPLQAQYAARRILSFADVPDVWMAVDLNVLVAASQPGADFVLTDIDLTGRGGTLPRGAKGRTSLEIVSVARATAGAEAAAEPTTLVSVAEKSPFIAPGKGWSRIGLPLGRGRLVEAGRVIGTLRHASSKSSLTRAAYVFVVDPQAKPPDKATLEFVSTDAMLRDALGFRFEGMTTLSPG